MNTFKYDADYLEAGDSFEGSSIEQSQFISAVMAAGGEVDVDGKRVIIVQLPRKKAVELVAEEPVAEELVAEEPVAVEPVAEEPVAEEPVAEEPVAEEPVAEEPVAEEPVAEEPVAEEPVAEAPVSVPTPSRSRRKSKFTTPVNTEE